MANSNQSELVIEIKEILRKTGASNKTGWCIYRVPDDFREGDKDACTPKLLSIGPLHYNNKRLQKMEIRKWTYFKQFVDSYKIDLNDLVSFIKDSEKRVRDCYAENIKFKAKQLTKIIMLDAVFIIELFLRSRVVDLLEDDSLALNIRSLETMMLDLLLLENQLPFFVLEGLFDWAFHTSEPNYLPSFRQLTFDFFGNYNKQELKPDDDAKIYHFTGLLRSFHLPQSSSSTLYASGPLGSNNEVGKLNFNATKLHETGLKFKVNDDSQCLLDFEFSGCVLKIPKIVVDEDTGVEFRNMVAFEQCHCPYDSYITDYVTVLDYLIDTGKDVDVLVDNEIILNHLDDSDAVAKVFNGFGNSVISANCRPYYYDICRELNEFYRNPCQKLKATLRSDYCKTPWQTAASVAGILLLILTLIQTIFSGVQVWQL